MFGSVQSSKIWANGYPHFWEFTHYYTFFLSMHTDVHQYQCEILSNVFSNLQISHGYPSCYQTCPSNSLCFVWDIARFSWIPSAFFLSEGLVFQVIPLLSIHLLPTKNKDSFISGSFVHAGSQGWKLGFNMKWKYWMQKIWLCHIMLEVIICMIIINIKLFHYRS